jgi:hypothetical protein
MPRSVAVRKRGSNAHPHVADALGIRVHRGGPDEYNRNSRRNAIEPPSNGRDPRKGGSPIRTPHRDRHRGAIVAARGGRREVRTTPPPRHRATADGADAPVPGSTLIALGEALRVRSPLQLSAWECGGAGHCASALGLPPGRFGPVSSSSWASLSLPSLQSFDGIGDRGPQP